MTMQRSSETAWYLRIGADDVGRLAVLVGDRGRALLARELLDGAVVRNEDRGLTVVTGTWRDEPMAIAAFGMGAPIAAICLHELAALGVTEFVRAGTMLTHGPTRLGDLILAKSALVHDGTSATYAAAGDRVDADPALLRRAARHLPPDGVVTGLTASADGFYTQLTDLLGGGRDRAALEAVWDREGVVGLDMETAAIYSAASALSVRAASVCLGSVDGRTNERMEGEERGRAERRLLEAAFEILVSPTDRTEDR